MTAASAVSVRRKMKPTKLRKDCLHQGFFACLAVNELADQTAFAHMQHSVRVKKDLWDFI
jgi:hypothetical protein